MGWLARPDADLSTYLLSCSPCTVRACGTIMANVPPQGRWFLFRVDATPVASARNSRGKGKQPSRRSELRIPSWCGNIMSQLGSARCRGCIIRSRSSALVHGRCLVFGLTDAGSNTPGRASSIAGAEQTHTAGISRAAFSSDALTPLDDQRDALSAADAHGCKAIAPIAAVQLMDKLD